MKLTERQRNMLRDIARFDFAKYPYRAMPAEEVAVRDFRVMEALLRKGFVEYPRVYDHHGKLPQMDIDCVRITQAGKEALQRKESL